MVKRVLFVLILLFIITYGSALADSVSTAIRVVDDFYKETSQLLKGLLLEKDLSTFQDHSIREKEKTIAEIKRIRWTEDPGKRRAQHIMRIVDLYTREQIESVKGLVPEDEERLRDVINRLSAKREEVLSELTESFKYEVPRKKKIRPVPSIDISPFEDQPEGGRGIWDR